MECADVERTWIEGNPIGAEIRAHLDACEACRALAEDDAGTARALAATASGGASVDFGDLEAAVAQAIAGERTVVARARAWSRPARVAAIGALVLAEAAFFATFLRRADWGTYPAWRMVATLGVFALGAAILAGVGFRPLHRPAPSRRAEAGLLAAALALPALIALLPAVPTTAPEAEAFNYPGWAYYCFVDGGGLAVAVLLLARLLDRGGHTSRATAVAAVAAAGFAGLLGLQIQCPINYPLHLLTGHASIPIGLALAYLLFRRS
jgi:predicted anti-sigma-YlaC factor YlaD